MFETFASMSGSWRTLRFDAAEPSSEDELDTIRKANVPAEDIVY